MTREIPLTQGKFALVDDEDYETLSAVKWCAAKIGWTFYAKRSIRRSDGVRTVVCMHRVILPDVEEIDHINGNGLDNRRGNLRPVTRSQNRRNSRKRTDNTSGHIGVYWHKQKRRWEAQVKLDGRRRSAGYYDTPEEAARARDALALELHGSYAKLNFPRGGVCRRCGRPELECSGHWADNPKAARASVAVLTTEGPGVVWSTVFPREETER